MTYEGLLNTSITKRTEASSQNSLGEWTHTYSDGTTGIKCRLRPMTAEERTEPTGIFSDVKYVCYMLSSASIDKGDRLKYKGEEYFMKELYMDSDFHHKRGYITLL